MKTLSLAFLLLLVSLHVNAEEPNASFPILDIPRSAGSDALLQHELTAREKQLFHEMDTQAASLPEDADLSAYHELAVRIGKLQGLTAAESVAFFTRTTFSEFEP